MELVKTFVYGGWVGTVVLIPIVVSSLDQAEQQAYMIEHMLRSS